MKIYEVIVYQEVCQDIYFPKKQIPCGLFTGDKDKIQSHFEKLYPRPINEVVVYPKNIKVIE